MVAGVFGQCPAPLQRLVGPSERSGDMETRLLDQFMQRLSTGASRRGAVRLLTTGAAAALGGAALEGAAAKGKGKGDGNSQQAGNQTNGQQGSGKSKRHQGSGNGKGHRSHNGKKAQGAKAAGQNKTCLQVGADCGDADRCCGQGHYCAATASTLNDKKTVCCKASGMACANDDECCGGRGACTGGFCSAR
jgi:hypothetical protein